MPLLRASRARQYCSVRIRLMHQVVMIFFSRLGNLRATTLNSHNRLLW